MGWWPGQAVFNICIQRFSISLTPFQQYQRVKRKWFHCTSARRPWWILCPDMAPRHTRAYERMHEISHTRSEKKRKKKTHPHSPRIILSQLHNALPNVRLYWGQSSNERHALPAAVLVTLAVNSPSTSVSWCRLVALRSSSNEALWPPMWL